MVSCGVLAGTRNNSKCLSEKRKKRKEKEKKTKTKKHKYDSNYFQIEYLTFNKQIICTGPFIGR